MSDLSYKVPASDLAIRRTNWGAIWGGTFVFMAIWSVFAALGFAIFNSAASLRAAPGTYGINVGMTIWLIVLTAIAMWFAGQETGRIAGVTNRHDALVHGLIMFGLSVVGLAILAARGGALLDIGTGVNGVVHTTYFLPSLPVWAGVASLRSFSAGWLPC
jgi:hypothetical protein